MNISAYENQDAACSEVAVYMYDICMMYYISEFEYQDAVK